MAVSKTSSISTLKALSICMQQRLGAIEREKKAQNAGYTTAKEVEQMLEQEKAKQTATK